MKIAQIAPLMESVPPRLYGGYGDGSSPTSPTNWSRRATTSRCSRAGSRSPRPSWCPAAPSRSGSNPTRPRHHSRTTCSCSTRCAAGSPSSTSCISTSTSSTFRSFSDDGSTNGHDAARPAGPARPASRSIAAFPTCRSSRFRTLSARRSRMPTWLAPFITACRAIFSRRRCDPRGGYLAFLGRISPEKRPDRAIAIARAVGMPLKIAAKVDRVDEAYFAHEIEPLLKDPGRVHRRDRRAATRPSSSARRGRCCSRSTGPSRSAWS